MPHDHLPPRIAAETADATGAYLVFFHHECDEGAACDHVERFIQRRPVQSSEYAARLPEFRRAVREQGAGYFPEFRIAIVDPTMHGLDEAAMASMRDLESVASIRPEYTVAASGWLCRMLGLEKRRETASAVNPRPTTPAQPAEHSPADSAAETWGLRAVGADVSGYTGSGVKVCILDTGFDMNHPDYAGRTIVAESFVDGETPQDGAGHGTHVAGSAVGPVQPATGVRRYGVAPGADLYVGKVLSDNGTGREGDMLAGILWAMEQGCDIISMSLGRRPMPGDNSGDFDRIGQAALERGSLIIAAAGNESARSFGQISPVSAPAVARSIMAVGALEEDLGVADFSNGGLDPDGGEINISGPGVNVFSSVPGGGHASYAGTSMATPHVSGVAAQLAESDPALRGQALWDALVGGAKALESPAQDVGAGITQSPKKGGGALV